MTAWPVGRRLYTLGLWLFAPLALLRLVLRSRRQPEYLQHLGERFGRYGELGQAETDTVAPLIWLHAVSVGETQAARPLIEALRARMPQAQLLITHMTPTGRASAQALFGDQVRSVYLPYDFPFSVGGFLVHFSPTLGLIMETELWPNLISGCARTGTPLYLVNARLSERSAARYRRFPRLSAAALRGLSGVLAQTAQDADRLRALGAPAVTVTGNVKFDALPAPAQIALGEAWRARWTGTPSRAAAIPPGGPRSPGEPTPCTGTPSRAAATPHGISAGSERTRPVWVAASTREGEEALLLDLLPAVTVPDALLVLVPRHPQRFDEVARLLEASGVRFVRRSADGAIEALADPSIRVLLGDSMGELAAYYSASDLAFVGGSLLPLGGQNLIEACALGLPVLVGPHTFNFREVAEQAIAAGAALRVADAGALAGEVNRLLGDNAARAVMGRAGKAFAETHRGATARTLERLFG